MLEPDRDQLEIFIEALLRHVGGQGFISLRSFYEDDALGAFRITPTSLAGGLGFLVDVAEDDARRAANAPRPVVFCPPLAVFGSKERATEKDLIAGPTLSVECDKDPQNARFVLEQLLGPATVVVKSGGVWTDPRGEQQDKLHLHWRLAQPAATPEQFKRLKQAREFAAHIVGGDPSNTPVCHPIRWPGSWHRKSEPRLCTIEIANPDNEIWLDDAFAMLVLSKNINKKPGEDSSHDNGEQRTEWEDAFAKILSGDSYHPTLAPLAASYASWGAPEPVTDNVLRSLLINSKPQDPERIRRRDAELAKLPQTVASAYLKFGKTEEQPEQKRDRLHWHGEDLGTPVRAWLVNGLLPETGVGLISGQWGTYKTFVALDLAAAIMAGLAFIDYPITRNGGVLFIAAEGASEISTRLEAVLKAKYPNHTNRLPFAWLDECPRLLAAKAVEALASLAREAGERMRKDFGLPLALVIIDTMVDAAGYSKPGDENDAALAQLVMRRCAELSRLAGALVLGIDHFGKAVETGTRGSSAKEGRADVVLALLGDKAISGEVSNMRLAVRKNRAGPGGRELPFSVRSIDMGASESGEPVTSLVIEWSSQPPSPLADRSWSKSLRLLRRILMTMLADNGKEVHPFADGPIVRACDLDIVRAEFEKQYIAEGTLTQKSAVRRQAFRRAVLAAQEKNLIAIRELAGVQWVWLAIPDDGQAGS